VSDVRSADHGGSPRFGDRQNTERIEEIESSELPRINSRLRELADDIDDAKAAADAVSEISEHESEITDLREEIDDLESTIEELRSERSELEARTENISEAASPRSTRWC